MKQLLLSCDEYIYTDGSNYYVKNDQAYDLFERYLRVFDRLKIVNRTTEIIEIPLKYRKLDLSNKEIISVPLFQGPIQYVKKYLDISKRLKKVTDGCDAAILRLPSTIAFRVWKEVLKSELPYAVEVVYDSMDGCISTKNIIHKILWLKINKEQVLACNKAIGVSCVTKFYLQKRYFSMQKNAFYSYYSSLSLDKSDYDSPRKYPQKKTFQIIHVANQVQFNGRKGHNELIEIVNILRQNACDIHVTFVGMDYLNGIKKLQLLAKELGVANYISFRGYVSREELFVALRESDIFIFPTKAEGLPRVIIEAMAVGLPCISTSVSGNSELLQDSFLFDYEDVHSMAEGIQNLINDSELYEQVSLYNFNKSLEYESSILEKRRDDFYNKLKNYSSKSAN